MLGPMTLGALRSGGAGGFAPSDVPQAEADALMVLYDNGGGASWTNNTGWGTDPVVGNWFGVTVSGGHVTRVQLQSNGGAGDISAFDPAALPSLARLYLYQNNFSGDLSGWTLPASLARLYLYQNNFSGGPPLPAASALTTYRIEINGLSTAAVDAILRGIYAASGSRTGSNGTIDVGGSNAPPSGTHQAAASCPVTSSTPGKEVAHELVNDGCGAITNHWATVTFTA